MRYALLLVTLSALVSPRPLHAQRLSTIATGAAVASLWIDYVQMRTLMDNGFPQKVLGVRLTTKSLTIVNATEVALNVLLPSRYRGYVNIATIAFHVPYLLLNARHAIGANAHGPVRVGWRLWL